LEASIPYAKPSITKVEMDLVAEAMAEGWGTNSNFYISKFEDDFSKKIGITNAIATSSCTGALHLGLAAAGIGPGDEIILADSNWVATLAPILYLGAKPVFVDIERDSWCIDPELVEKAINGRTRAIIATHLYGNLCDMGSLLRIARKYNILLIEDAAEALGSTYREKSAGTLGDFGVFSFHGSKTITTGEGGMLVTEDAGMAVKVRQLNNHGRDAKSTKQFWPELLGYKYKMGNIQAAIGIAQIQRFEELVSRKVEIFDNYINLAKNINGISFNQPRSNCKSGYWMPNVLFDASLNVNRESILEAFKVEKIDARVFFWPLSDLPFMESSQENTVSKEIAMRSINLPSFHEISNFQQKRILDVVERIVQDAR
jgi:perosamine synthetase